MSNYYLLHSNAFGWGKKQTLAQYKIDELLPLVTGNKILDIGCGPGSFVNELSTRGFEATGIDITSKFISFARKNYQGNFLVADAYDLPFKDREFDTVFVRNVLEHLENDLKALKEAIRVGNKVVITVPHQTPLNLRNRGLIFSHYQDRSHLRTYTFKTLKQLISQTKYVISDIKYSEPLPVRSIVFELFSGFSIFKRIAIKLFYTFFSPTKYYLELIAIIKP
jgi:ubiquinone/menaquinone biosynthesis C-methylase UbiE